MDTFFDNVTIFSDFLWGGTWGDRRILEVGPITIALLGTGVFTMIVLGGRPLKRLFPAFAELWAGRKKAGEGEITPWQALSTALSGQVGTGNLAGVATAITLGGPGAIFWMWVTAIFGMALAYAESSLAVRFREKHPDGHYHGGPMYYIQNGLGKNWKWLAVLFCIGTILSALATGGAIQANSVTQSAVEASTSLGIDLPRWVVGALLAFLVFVVIIGGIKSIGTVAGRVVPFMAAAYILVALIILITHANEIPDAFVLIFTEAFGFREAAGGFAGYVILAAIRAGVARGLFSNEAGQGSAPIAHAAAQTSNPVKQGEIAMLGVFIDTMIICTMTALVILVVSGSYANLDGSIVEFAWQSDALQASAITTAAFAEGIYAGGWIILAAQALFAFTTIIGWSYYAETSATYIIGDWAARPFRFVWVAVAFLGTLIVNVDGLWRVGDVANSMMLLPNVIAILLLTGVVVRYTQEYDRKGIVPPAWHGDTPRDADGKPVNSPKSESVKGEKPAG
ncbi:MAG TPA: sodium:alanine symporter family protein [Oceanicaulis sp.]|mgnify:FL=1|uniref:Sodium:alanine symporter n=1 Tax=Glycocaulis albus TaxID=1382801 RepID=A0ABQ1XYW2_9PROT|nr:alanine/glycine:cation symporter family protein [Glycocaulis albus]GGH06665.1 sodium:alanine symporter [Glycocaulis albus]HCY54279.1 sodium:alanine symporter family protein [Oceanicaulis sp.]